MKNTSALNNSAVAEFPGGVLALCRQFATARAARCDSDEENDRRTHFLDALVSQLAESPSQSKAEVAAKVEVLVTAFEEDVGSEPDAWESNMLALMRSIADDLWRSSFTA